MKIFTFPKRPDLALVIRGLAALSVLLWHGGFHAATNAISHYFIVPGRTAVWIFFAISGYLLTRGFTARKYQLTKFDLIRFYYNRALRIYPLFLFVTAFCLALTPNWRALLNLRFLAKNLLVFINYHHEYPLNGVFWTLGIEVQFYLLFPFLYFLQSTTRGLRPIVLYFLFCFSLTVLKKFDQQLLRDSRSFLGNLMHFQVGIIIALNRLQILKLEPHKNWLKLLGVSSVIILIFTNKLYHTSNELYFGLSGLFLVDSAIAGFLMLHVIMEENHDTLHRFNWKLGYILGILSYGLYCWHPILISSLKLTEVNYLALILGSLLASLVSYIIFERPFIKLKL